MWLNGIGHNRRLTEHLSAILADGRLVHAYLFTGQHGPALEIAEAFARGILRTDRQEDLLRVQRGERGRLQTEDIENMQERLKFKPFGDRRVSIIDEADLMTPQAQNKLLKTLEEPPAGNVILLTAERRDALLPTVLSRCIEFALEPVPGAYDAGLYALACRFGEACAQSTPYYRLKDCLSPLLEDKTSLRENGLEFLNALEDLFRRALWQLSAAGQPGGPAAGADAQAAVRALCRVPADRLAAAIRQIEETGKSLRLSLNASYALKALCLDLSGRDLC